MGLALPLEDEHVSLEDLMRADGWAAQVKENADRLADYLERQTDG